ncbi:MAG: class I SAM-dependent methyltransferase [Gemmatimonas sp.]
MKCMRGEEPVGYASTLTVDQFLKEMAAPRRALPPSDALPVFGAANPRGGLGPFHRRRLTVDRPLNSKMSGRIGVALAHRARTEEGGEGAVRLAMPADLRHYRPGERIAGNFFGGLHIEVPPDADADDIALKIVQALYTGESIKRVGLFAGDRVASLAALQVGIYFELAHVDDTGRYRFSATLSNLGLLKSAELSAPGFQVTSAFFVPLEGDSGCTITINGYDQHTEVVLGLSHRFAGEGRLDAFVDLVLDAIEAKPKPETTARKFQVLPAVSATAILTLRARAEEHERSAPLFADPLAADWFRRVQWPTKLDRWWSTTNAGNGIALRADAIDHIVSQYHSSVESLSVAELGCGLSTRQSRLSNLTFAKWVDVDLHEMMEVRRALGAKGEQVAASVLDYAWMDRVHVDASQHLFIAEGLLYYLERAQVDALFVELKRRFPGAAIVFDVVGANDYATLLENTASAGAPIAWHLEGNYSDALSAFGLGVIGELDPDRVMKDAVERYWNRFTSAERVGIYFVMNSPELMRGRSGTVLGRLG